MSDTKIWLHPFKEGIYGLLHRHFSDAIVKNFWLEFETNIYNADVSENIWRQKKDNNLVLEVRYKNTPDTYEYICDLKSWESKAQTEYTLLKYITDKVKAKKIGKNWIQEGDKIGVSREIVSGKFETKGGE